MVQEIRYNTPIYLNSQNLNNQTSKNIYKNLLNSQNISIPLGFSIWLKKINIKFYSEIEKSLTFVFKNMKENKFKVYKWKLIHYILSCKELLFKWHITTNYLCNNCQITEKYAHFFECKRLETFWRIIKNLFSKLKLGEHILNLKNLVTGYKIKEEYDDINYLLTILHIKKLLNFKSKERNM
jgi:hypothetical protein